MVGFSRFFLPLCGLGGFAMAALPTVAQPLAQAGISMSDIRPVEVDSEGTGATADSAVAKALANAIAQETGTDVGQVTLSGDAAVQGSLRETQKTQTEAGTNGYKAKPKTTTTDKAVSGDVHVGANAVASFSGGRVARYSVISTQVDAKGVYTAKVHAVLELYRRAASAADLRKTLAVGTIEDPTAPELGASLHDQLIIDLTQANRFAILDRSHNADYADEIATVQSGDAAPEARAHAGQALGADFVLTGVVRIIGAKTVGHAAQTTSHTIELTGEVVSHTSASTLHKTTGEAMADFEVMEVATRRIVLADRARVTGDSVEALAQHITDSLVGTIYPPRLVSVADPNALVISQGGSGVFVGEQFRLLSEGTELFDPYTHESLGRTEQVAGMIEVTDVEPRISYARLVDGALPPGQDIVLRPVPPPLPLAHTEPAARRRRAVAAPVADDASGGTKLPGDP